MHCNSVLIQYFDSSHCVVVAYFGNFALTVDDVVSKFDEFLLDEAIITNMNDSIFDMLEALVRSFLNRGLKDGECRTQSTVTHDRIRVVYYSIVSNAVRSKSE